MSEWTPTSFEDRLLTAYHDMVGGRMYTEVAVAWGMGYEEWPAGHSPRSIDAIRILEPYHEETIVPFVNRGQEVLRVVENADVELIEVKRSLNRNVIGQVVAGRELFAADYAPANVRSLALCANSDSALEWVCDRQDITVEITDPIEKSEG